MEQPAKQEKYARFEDEDADGDAEAPSVEGGGGGEALREAGAGDGENGAPAAPAADEAKRRPAPEPLELDGSPSAKSGGPLRPGLCTVNDRTNRSPYRDATPTVLGRAVFEEDCEDVNGIELEVAGRPQKDDGTGKKPKTKIAPEQKLASSRRTFINSVICFIGSGMYGLPMGFQRFGVLGGLAGMFFVASVSLHCMFLVVDLRNFLENVKNKKIKTYGDIGYYAFGICGARLVDFFVALTQLGACIAYLIIISQSMHEVIRRIRKRTWILMCMPLLIRASWLRSLKSIAPLSLVAEIGTISAAVIVLAFDVLQVFENESGNEYRHDVPLKYPVNGTRLLSEELSLDTPTAGDHDPLVLLNWVGLPYFFGVSIYTFEGIGMVIPVYNSMAKSEDFKSVWGMAFVFVAFLNTSFGFMGYYAYRSGLQDIIISNLPEVFLTTVMKISLCVGLYFTYPLMLFPVIEMAEESLQRPASTTWCGAVKWNAMRSGMVVGSCIVAASVPRFTFFIALIGASGGAALAFVLPAAFHLKLRWQELDCARKCRELFCVIVGILGGTVGTLQALKDLKDALETGADVVAAG